MSDNETPPLGVQIDAAVMRHPAGNARPGLGMQLVELDPPRLLSVTAPIPGKRRRREEIGTVRVPPTYALECVKCGHLFRPGSPFVLPHHEAHRRRTPVQRARIAAAYADHYIRRLFGKG